MRVGTFVWRVSWTQDGRPLVLDRESVAPVPAPEPRPLCMDVGLGSRRTLQVLQQFASPVHSHQKAKAELFKS